MHITRSSVKLLNTGDELVGTKEKKTNFDMHSVLFIIF